MGVKEAAVVHRIADLRVRQRNMSPGTEYFMQEVRAALSAASPNEGIPGEHTLPFGD